jgi:transcriptional regulator with XRE-family HTH domain
MGFVERLKSYMNENNLKQIDLAKELQINRSSLSNILNERRKPSNDFIESLSKISGKSIHYWLFGQDEYDGLISLNELIDFFIKNDSIKEDGTMDDETRKIIYTMLEKEIRVKLENKKAQR